MGVTIADRCPYNNPSEKFVRRFEDESVLADVWAASHPTWAQGICGSPAVGMC